jgi:conjugative transposon TraN protein
MKKSIALLSAILWVAGNLFAQNTPGTYRSNLPEILICRDMTLHFISPEPIRYVDISTPGIAGDLPLKNILRVKIIPDSLWHLFGGEPAAVVTIVGESFIAQYQLRLAVSSEVPGILTQVNILPEQTRPLDVPGIILTDRQLKAHALAILSDHDRHAIRQAKEYGILASLNHLYTVGDLVLLDLSFKNETNLNYAIDELRFKIEDKKITKATNSQSIELKPVWQLYPLGSFKKTFRNIYVLRKTTFPDNKILDIELTEKQVSGRSLTLQVKYQDILKADTM